MKGILPIFLVIAIASAATIQRNRRDTGQTPKETTDFENFVATIQSAGEEFKNTFQKVATQISDNPEVKKAVDNAKTVISETVDKFNSQYPQATELIKKLQDKGQEVVSTIKEEIEKNSKVIGDQIKSAVETKQ